ncbi:MAG TPA: pyruvate kinase [Candidatus Yonathbacteria bacterium]|nr:pyruvate kinase [Candidatus Yonathbacteria bacterium]
MTTKIRKTKIVTTIGPASGSKEVFTRMVKAGVNVVRLNFSHGDHNTHSASVHLVRGVSKNLNIPIAIMQDLGGPKIRTGEQYKEEIVLRKGSKIILTTKKCIGDETKLCINYKKLPKEVKKGNFILLDDGKKKLEVISKGKDFITCKVIVGGMIKAKRGVNLPDVSLSISSLTQKDKEDVVFGIKENVDFIALSFVRKASDVRELKSVIEKLGGTKKEIGIIAKIETKDALNNLDEILEEVDGIMVARGDLAVETPPEDVPVVQKEIIKKCNMVGKPVIVATQMLESMIFSPVATRAEVSDVANSIFDGADAIMLSAESAIGEYPVETVTLMSKIAVRTEAGIHHKEALKRGKATIQKSTTTNVVDAISRHVVSTAYDVDSEAIIALTETGSTARMISRYRPKQPIVVMSPNEKTLRKVVLSFGCYPVKIKPFRYIGEAVERIKRETLKHKFANKGSNIVIAAGVPFRKTGGTNMLFVREV